MKRNLKDIIKNYDLFLQNEKDKFYIYIHYTKDEDIPFYVGQVCRGEKKSHLGFKWCFVKNYNNI